MRIGLFSSEKSVVQVVPLVAEKLRAEILGAEITESVAPDNLAIVSRIASSNQDAIAVILFYPADSPDVRVLMEKLVELDSQGKRIMNFLEEGAEFDEDDEAERICSLIMKRLFGRVPEKKGGRGSFTSLI